MSCAVSRPTNRRSRVQKPRTEKQAEFDNQLALLTTNILKYFSLKYLWAGVLCDKLKFTLHFIGY